MTAHRITRRTAVNALREAAGSLHVAPAELTAAGYRAYRGEQLLHDRRPPSELTIRLLFGTWERACAEAGQMSWRVDAEDDVRRRLYGRPA